VPNDYLHLVEKTGYTKSTISRTLRHCSGVDSETRRIILQAQENLSDDSPGECAVYAILPDTPHYFWKQAYRGMCDTFRNHPSISFKPNIYTSLRDTDIVLAYLEEAERMNARAVILTASDTPEIRRTVTRMQKNCAFFLLSEYIELVNTFFIGADAYADGFRMGELFGTVCRDRIPLVMSYEKTNINIHRRICGFTDAVRKYVPVQGESLPVLSIPNIAGVINRKLLPSRGASLLAEHLEPDILYCLYVPFGLSGISLALKKSGHADSIFCLCHDCSIQEDRTTDGVAASMNQDIYRQGCTAADAAIVYIENACYPKQKYLYIPSEIIRNTPKTE